ncbi:MAG TPA: AAA family ATPase [Microbacteriaceae bacterium]|nr:AAA family ATPase [Microbacteriaceae bacterium]
MSVLLHDPFLNEVSALFAEFNETKRALLLDAQSTLDMQQKTLIKSLINENDWDALNQISEGLPSFLGLHINALTQLATSLDLLLQDEKSKNLVDRALTFRAQSLRIAIRLHKQLKSKKALLAKTEDIYNRAFLSKRFPTSFESKEISLLQSDAASFQADLSAITSEELRDAVLQNVATLRIRDANKELTSGLLLTPQMEAIIAESVPAISRGEPMLLIGETGGAKTALAEHLAKKLHQEGHEFISGFGDISSTQVIGAHELRVEDKATSSVFVPGPLLRAMKAGTPIILDEINAMPPEFLKRLNRILQLVPGEEYRVQENAGRPVTVAAGFVIIATANEQSSERYRGIFSLSSELINRFGANTFRVEYPDADLDFRDVPVENLLLATIALSNSRGVLTPKVTETELESVARFAFITQQIFSGRYGEGFDTFISNDQRIDGRPGLEENVFAPRTLVKLLNNVRDSGGALTVAHALKRFVDGVMNPNDRAVLSHIMRTQGF